MKDLSIPEAQGVVEDIAHISKKGWWPLEKPPEWAKELAKELGEGNGPPWSDAVLYHAAVAVCMTLAKRDVLSTDEVVSECNSANIVDLFFYKKGVLTKESIRHDLVEKEYLELDIRFAVVKNWSSETSGYRVFHKVSPNSWRELK